MKIDLSAEPVSACGSWSESTDKSPLTMVSSLTIPCGAHAGDPAHMLAACADAAERSIPIGALVGYRDLAGRGQRFIDYAADDLTAEVLYQIGGLDAIALTEGTRVSFLRPAGALMEAVQTDRHHAWAIVNAILDYDSALVVVGERDSMLLQTATRHGLTTAAEFTPTRRQPGGRRAPSSLDPSQVADEAVRAAYSGDYATIRLDARR
ncbi:MAG: LamB/YcsF family protein [Micropruina sp.]|nr:LamB/YcsF family protein [Micropruina sp.]